MKNKALFVTVMNIVIIALLIFTNYSFPNMIVILLIANILFYYLGRAQDLGLGYFETRMYLLKRMILVLGPAVVVLILISRLYPINFF